MGNPMTKGVTRDMSFFMVTKNIVPAVTKLYEQQTVWQGDLDTICCTEAALEAS